MPGKAVFPLIMILLGVAIAVGVFVALLALEFVWIDLAYYVPALALSGALIFVGRAKARKAGEPTQRGK
jgi:hypothetical protein